MPEGEGDGSVRGEASREDPLAAQEVFILAGGKGTRLREVWVDKPKILAPVQGRPYFDWLVEALRREGLQRLCFLLGVGAKQVERHIEGHAERHRISCEIEDEPLGTGGAVAAAWERRDDGRRFAVNGDSYCRINYAAMLEAHRRTGAACTMALARVADRSDYGGADVSSEGRIRGFEEKGAGVGAGLVNAGVYLMEKRSLGGREGAFSLEREVFPELARRGELWGFEAEGELLDIGTPERLGLAQTALARLMG